MKRPAGTRRTRKRPQLSIEELKALAFADPRDLFDPDGRGKVFKDLPANVRGTLAGVQLDKEGRIRGFRYKNKLSALIKLGRMLGMFRSRRKARRGAR